MRKNLCLLIITCFLISCGKKETYKPIDPDSLKRWEPRSERLSQYGNHSPYEVFGKTYRVNTRVLDFEQIGYASWYGKKFHGRLTSNQEVFDMYKLTAAHKTLPLPSYAEVTNLSNNKKVVVRVNDRGPFVGDRIIDLSYAAASVLDFVNDGVTKVKIEVLKSPPETMVRAGPNFTRDATYLQLGAFNKKKTAKNLAKTVGKFLKLDVFVSDVRTRKGTLHRVRVGPMKSENQIRSVTDTLVSKGLSPPQVVVD
ncbi:septal ring lytic transglycosylase RlpA family protein [Marinicella sp. W31]|uniref:septal ring lytic transglycosylase RlpA family protein n=1 Tax=Marinicella sp. W31 TaxID=3023713 RepID=UPI003758498D